jgi:hypothetical protein
MTSPATVSKSNQVLLLLAHLTNHAPGDSQASLECSPKQFYIHDVWFSDAKIVNIGIAA